MCDVKHFPSLINLLIMEDDITLLSSKILRALESIAYLLNPIEQDNFKTKFENIAESLTVFETNLDVSMIAETLPEIKIKEILECLKLKEVLEISYKTVFTICLNNVNQNQGKCGEMLLFKVIKRALKCLEIFENTTYFDSSTILDQDREFVDKLMNILGNITLESFRENVSLMYELKKNH